jgi:hypothetical protein
MKATAQGRSREVVGFQGPFAANRVAEQDREKVDLLVVSEAATGEANLLNDGVEDSPLVRRWESRSATSPNQGCVAGTEREEVWIVIDESAILVMVPPYQGSFGFVPDRQAHL